MALLIVTTARNNGLDDYGDKLLECMWTLAVHT